MNISLFGKKKKKKSKYIETAFGVQQ